MSTPTPHKAKVAIKCLVYNHEPYLRDCLEGFVMQQTDFPFVAIVHDDASTDHSADIIREYAAKYPDIIFPIYETENQYSKKDGSLRRIMDAAIAATEAPYIALCEGDDYWTDPHKLQKQVDILEHNLSLMLCCTACSVVDNYGHIIETKRLLPVVKDNEEGQYTIRDFFAQAHQYPTASVLYRNSHVQEVSEKQQIMSNPYLGDWTLWVALLCFGDAYFLDEVTTAYRINPNSLTHDVKKRNLRRLGLAKADFYITKGVISILPDEYDDIKQDLRDTSYMWFNLANAYKHIHRYISMIACLMVCGMKNPKVLYHKLKKRD